MTTPSAWRPPAVLALACLLSTSLATAGCESCTGCGESSPPLATLVAVQGDHVQRDFAASPAQWVPVKPGATFVLNDGLKTGADTLATLNLIDGSELLTEPHTLIRFRRAAAPGQRRVDVETGEALFHVGKSGLVLETALGTAVLRSGSEVRLSPEDGSTLYTVELGSAEFRSGGQSVTVEEGQTYEVGIGVAEFRTAAEDEPPLDAGTDAARDARIHADEEEELDRSLGKPALEEPGVGLSPGSSLTVHTPQVPVVISLPVADLCPEMGVIQLSRPTERYYGEGAVSFEMKAGSRAYLLRCAEDGKLQRKIRARGRVRVLRDSGRRRLPTKAPTTRVDADGRTYHILYQNQLPTVIVRWPLPPKAEAYKVVVDGEPRQTSKPELRFRSGQLRDGRHSVYFEAAGRRSRTSTLAVSFDNAAPKAAVSSPDDRSFAPGDTVSIEGVALPGWQVSVDRGELEVDASHRFHGTVTTSAEHPHVVLRLRHPRRGTHLYIRTAETGS